MLPFSRLLLLCSLAWLPWSTAPAQQNTDQATNPATAAATDGTAVTETDAGADGATESGRDVVLVLDNSGSMRQNDPQSLAPAAVRQFIEGLNAKDRVAIMVFDQDVTLVQDFVSLQAGRQTLLDSVNAIDYKGQYTNSPAAIERAVYALKNNARTDARRMIIFMTDGIVDTGDAQQDASASDWLRNDLASDAARSDIRIFAIAFTNDADYQLIQSLANKTEGDYFRALTAADLGNVFSRINEVIAREAEAESLSAAPSPPSQSVQAPQPVIIEVPAQSQDYRAEERNRTLILIAAAGVLALTLIAILIVLIKRSRGDRPVDDHEPEAYLNDMHGLSGKQSHRLGKRPTMLGRAIISDGDHLHYVSIPETTVGRRHALIEYKDYAYWIIDQSSINGTYVNDKLVTTEVRLKHGDRIRLHKYELEFVMPEMSDSGMTVVSNTVYARHKSGDAPGPAAGTAPAGAVRETGDDAFNDGDLFDISGGHDVAEDNDNDDSTPSEGRITLSEEDYSGSEDGTVPKSWAGTSPSGPAAAEDDDVTLTPGMDSDPGNEDMTMQHLFSADENNAGDDSDEWERGEDDNRSDGRGKRD